MAENSKKTARGPGRPFEPGKSGNPGGRPKVVDEFRAKARKAVDEKVVDRWIEEVQTNGDEWVKCSELLAAYGYGKPSQTIDMVAEVTTNPDTTPPMTRDERRAELRMFLAREAEANAAAIARGEAPPYRLP